MKFFKKPKKRKPLRILGNVLTGAVSGFLLSLIIIALLQISNFWIYVISAPLILFMAFQGWRHPVISEVWAFVLPVASLFITIGNAFGGGFMSLTVYEKLIFFTSIGLIILNLFSGDIGIRLKRVKEIVERTLGRK